MESARTLVSDLVRQEVLQLLVEALLLKGCLKGGHTLLELLQLLLHAATGGSPGNGMPSGGAMASGGGPPSGGIPSGGTSPSSPGGAIGYTSTGKRMVCKTTASDAKNRWRQG